MSANKDLRWFRASDFTGSAKRFAEFCKTDIRHQAKTDSGFDVEIYNEAVKLITNKLQTFSSPKNTGKDSQ